MVPHRVRVSGRRGVGAVRPARFFARAARPLDYDLKCKRAVRAEAQDAALRHLIEVGHFADEELRVVKWGRNASYGIVPTRLRG